MRVVDVTWERTRPLREQVLGWGSGPVPGDNDDATWHLAVVGASGEPIAVVSACCHPCPERVGVAATYLWAMAVAARFQGQGIGARLIDEPPRHLRSRTPPADLIVGPVRLIKNEMGRATRPGRLEAVSR